MNFLNHLTDGIPALLLFCIAFILFTPLYTALHTDPQGNRYYYAIPLIWILVLLVLLVAWVRLVFA